MHNNILFLYHNKTIPLTKMGEIITGRLKVLWRSPVEAWLACAVWLAVPGISPYVKITWGMKSIFSKIGQYSFLYRYDLLNYNFC